MNQPSNVTFKHGQVWEVRCPNCSVPIRKMVPDDTFQEVSTVNGRKVTRERLVLACLPNYREILIHCDDCTAHVACVCAECVPKLDDVSLQRIHDDEMAVQGVKTERKVYCVHRCANVIEE